MAKRLFVDLFAGCGGLSLGLEFAGFEPIAFSEISSEARGTYLLNRPQFPGLKNNAYQDAKELAEPAEAKKLLEKHGLKDGMLDLVCGGPPCQGFSRYGHRRTFPELEKQDIATNHLYVDMAKIVHNLQPKMFLFENVQGLVNARWRGDEARKHGEVFDDVITRFREETEREYTISWRLTRAFEFGVPQNRPRVIMIGIRQNIFEGLSSEFTGRPIPGKARSSREADHQKHIFEDDTTSQLSAQKFKSRFPQFTEFVDKKAKEHQSLKDNTTNHTIPEILGDLVDPRYMEQHTKGESNGRKRLQNRSIRRKYLDFHTYPHDLALPYFRLCPNTILEGWKSELGKKTTRTPAESAALVLVNSIESKSANYDDNVLEKDERHFLDEDNYWTMGKDTPVANHVYSLHTPTTIRRFTTIVEGRHSNAKEANVAQQHKFSQRRLPETWDGKDPKITITSMPDDFVHYDQPRSLTVRECARLQTFPDWYIFAGNRTTGGRRRAGDYEVADGRDEVDPAQLARDVPQYTQVGNAVPVWMARSIGRHLVKMLNDSEKNN